MQSANKLESLVESLSPIEKKIIPYLDKKIEEIKSLTSLDETTILRALRFLENKKIVSLKIEKKKIIDLGTNGIYYKKNHLPERRLLILIEKNNRISLEEAKKDSKLTDNEFKVSLGVLKDKAIIEIKGGKLNITSKKEELSKKTLEESLIDALPLDEASMTPEQKYALENLKKRKEIIEINEKNEVTFEPTELGESLIHKKMSQDLLEEVTPEIIKNWKRGKKFRKYDIQSPVPRINGGKKHFVNEAINYGKKVWTDLGFVEMTGGKTVSSFWNFDSLFTAQDHPVREMQDTFFIDKVEAKLPDKDIVKETKNAHEQGVGGSSGWQYKWNEEEAKTVLLRTHTTCLSAKTLASIDKKKLPAKFFAIGKVFRNETVDWSHGFEFNQSEGIVVDKNANFRHLLGYVKEFFAKMGYEKVRFNPCYYPYTEPSVEISAFNKEKGLWVELGGAGIFRPEVVIPLMGEYIPVLAWGPGFDRIIMAYYEIKDLREMYENNLAKLRKTKPWLK